jgi:hypothetical protein
MGGGCVEPAESVCEEIEASGEKESGAMAVQGPSAGSRSEGSLMCKFESSRAPREKFDVRALGSTKKPGHFTPRESTSLSLTERQHYAIKRPHKC